jgi:hypothetical protein
MINSKGQVTIFVIIALLVVAVIGVLIFINRESVTLREQNFDDPSVYLTTCLKDRAKFIIDSMLTNGGLTTINDSILYNTHEVYYLCKNINNFEPCVNQYPLYVSQMNRNFNNLIQADAQICFDNLKQELADRNYNVDSGPVKVESELKPDVVQITFNGELTLSKGGISQKFDRVDTYIPTKLQSIGFVVNEIVAQEAKWCYFSNDGFMTLYPEYNIGVYLMEDSTKIYTVKNKKSSETIEFATRGCVLPAGWF